MRLPISVAAFNRGFVNRLIAKYPTHMELYQRFTSKLQGRFLDRKLLGLARQELDRGFRISPVLDTVCIDAVNLGHINSEYRKYWQLEQLVAYETLSFVHGLHYYLDALAIEDIARRCIEKLS